MSSITPASFVDDGTSFHKRAPHGMHPAHIANWFNTTSSDTTSAYTGSYFDDGADMLDSNRNTPGFGRTGPRFYKQRNSKEHAKTGPWNDAIQKAIANDMQHNLEKMRSIRTLQVRRPDRHEDEEERVKHGQRKKKTVTVLLPPRWGTFIVKGNDGRVFVIDEDGAEFDSGPPQARVQQQQPLKWVKAPTTMSTPSLTSPLALVEQQHSQDKRSRGDKKSKHARSTLKALTPISESAYGDGYQPSRGGNLVSPTGFFMTGGKDGKPRSPVRSLPGSWPSPPLSPAKILSVSEKSTRTRRSEEGWSEKNSNCSGSINNPRSHKSSKHKADNVSMKSASIYRSVAVEDAPDTSSEKGSILKDTGWAGGARGGEWGGSNHGSEVSWVKSEKDNSKSSRYSAKAPSKDDWRWSQPASDYHPDTSVQNWIGDRIKTISPTTTGSHESRHSSYKSLSHIRSHAPSEEVSDKTDENSWDGYEIPKTLSEVSVAGSGSEREWPGSRTCSSQGSGRRSRRSSKQGVQSGWRN